MGLNKYCFSFWKLTRDVGVANAMGIKCLHYGMLKLNVQVKFVTCVWHDILNVKRLAYCNMRNMRKGVSHHAALTWEKTPPHLLFVRPNLCSTLKVIILQPIWNTTEQNNPAIMNSTNIIVIYSFRRAPLNSIDRHSNTNGSSKKRFTLFLRRQCQGKYRQALSVGFFQAALILWFQFLKTPFQNGTPLKTDRGFSYKKKKGGGGILHLLDL